MGKATYTSDGTFIPIDGITTYNFVVIGGGGGGGGGYGIYTLGGGGSVFKVTYNNISSSLEVKIGGGGIGTVFGGNGAGLTQVYNSNISIIAGGGGGASSDHNGGSNSNGGGIAGGFYPFSYVGGLGGGVDGGAGGIPEGGSGIIGTSFIGGGGGGASNLEGNGGNGGDGGTFNTSTNLTGGGGGGAGIFNGITGIGGNNGTNGGGGKGGIGCGGGGAGVSGGGGGGSGEDGAGGGGAGRSGAIGNGSSSVSMSSAPDFTYGIYGRGGQLGDNGQDGYVEISWEDIPTSDICFPAGTPIDTDQGVVSIEQLNTNRHSINGQVIRCITKTVTLDKYLIRFEKDSIEKNVPNKTTVMSKKHKILYKGQLVSAYRFLDMSSNIKKVAYSGEILYNILLDKHSVIQVNNLTCETLHPNNVIAILYRYGFSEESKQYVKTITNRKYRATINKSIIK